MPRSALYGRRIHITGSIVEDAQLSHVASCFCSFPVSGDCHQLGDILYKEIQSNPCLRRQANVDV